MGRLIFLFCLCSLLVCGSTILTGCSLIGYGPGSAERTSRAGGSVSIPEGVNNLPPQTEIFVLKKDSTIVKAVFNGVAPGPDTLPQLNYAEDFERWRNLPGNEVYHLPAFGAGVQIDLKGPQATSLIAGRFAGFDPGMIRLVTPGEGPITRLEVESIKAMYDSLRHVTTHDEIALALLAHAPVTSGRLQFRTTSIVLEGQPDIALSDIDTVKSCNYTDGRWTGFAIGLMFDVAITLVAVSIDTNPFAP
jgi:hypothetical protein